MTSRCGTTELVQAGSVAFPPGAANPDDGSWSQSAGWERASISTFRRCYSRELDRKDNADSHRALSAHIGALRVVAKRAVAELCSAARCSCGSSTTCIDPASRTWRGNASRHFIVAASLTPNCPRFAVCAACHGCEVGLQLQPPGSREGPTACTLTLLRHMPHRREIDMGAPKVSRKIERISHRETTASGVMETRSPQTSFHLRQLGE